MCQNKLFEIVCDIYSDHYGDCSSHVCLVQLLGEEEMLRKCRNLGLDKSCQNEYKEIEVRINNAK